VSLDELVKVRVVPVLMQKALLGLAPEILGPDSNFSSSTFGVITSTSVNELVGQLGLRLGF